VFWPVPSDAGTFHLAYRAVLPELATDASTPVIDLRWHRLLVWYGIAAAKEKDDDPAANGYFNKYTQGRAQFAVEQGANANLPMSTPNILDIAPAPWWPEALR